MRHEYPFAITAHLANALLWVVYDDIPHNQKLSERLFLDMKSYIDGLHDSVLYPRVHPRSELENDKC
jgi:hypothetical protein